MAEVKTEVETEGPVKHVEEEFPIPEKYKRYKAQFEEGGLIIPGYGAEGIKLGDSETYVQQRLGNYFNLFPLENCSYWEYGDKGINVRFENGKVTTIFLYNDNDKHRKYQGIMPDIGRGGITLDDNLGRVMFYSENFEPNEEGSDLASAMKYKSDHAMYDKRGLRVKFNTNRPNTKASIVYIVVTRPRYQSEYNAAPNDV